MLDGSSEEVVLVLARTRAGKVWDLAFLCSVKEMLTWHGGMLLGET